jgi:CRISPR/Cas system-associated endonuclease Cas1
MSQAREHLKSLQRIKSVQKQRHRMEEWRLVRLSHEEQGLRETQTALLDALNSDHPLHGLFLATLGRRVGAVGRELEAIAASRRQQAGKALEQARRLKVAEKFITTASLRVDEEERRESFHDYLDRFLDDDGSSLA